MKLCMTELDILGKNVFASKVGKRWKYRVFLKLLKNLVIFFFQICSAMKICTMCCVPCEIWMGHNAPSQSD